MTISIEQFASQGVAFRNLYADAAAHRIFHALIFAGNQGIGKKTFAFLLAQALLCRSSGERPCMRCNDCLMTDAREHPDLLFLSRERSMLPNARQDRSSIPVDDIRSIIDTCGTKTMNGGYRAVLLAEADRLTVQAQNCLLKTLEEPPESTCFILMTDRPQGLLDTLKSRCRTISFHRWENAYIREVLLSRGVTAERADEAVIASEGSIGRALQLAGDEAYWKSRQEILAAFTSEGQRGKILQISTQWKDRKQDAEEIFLILETFVRMLLDMRLKCPESMASAIPESWRSFSEKADLSRFTFLLDAISRARREAFAAVNFQAVLEQLLFCFMGEYNQWQT